MNETAPAPVRNRVKELKQVRAGDLVAHAKNYRVHPPEQERALRAALTEIGMAGTITVRPLAGGRYQILDGHLRAGLDPEALVPVAVTDLTEAEGEKLLATFDPIGAMAVREDDRLRSLIAGIEASQEPFALLLDRLTPTVSPTPAPRAMPRPVVSYELTFDTEAQQQRWLVFLQALKNKYGSAGSLAERLMLFLGEHGY